MHQHGPDQLIGPLRGSRAWWRGLAAPPDESGEGTQVPVRRRKAKNAAKTNTGIRHELVERIRQEIAAGTYDTEEKWEQVLDHLADRLTRE